MTKTDKSIYKAMLELLKNGSAFTYSSVSRASGLSRQTLHNKVDEHTYQDIQKYKKNR